MTYYASYDRYEPSLALFTRRGAEPTAAFLDLARALQRAFLHPVSPSAPCAHIATSEVPLPPLLSEDARLIVEFGHGQLDTVRGIFSKHTDRELRFVRASVDCNNLQRCLVYVVR